MTRSAVFSFLTFLTAILSSCTHPAVKLDDYGTVPHFTLTDSEGHPFDSNELNNKVWIVDFIFTNCPGPCPLMTSKMHKLAEQMKDDKNIRFLSISVDPERDTPAVLNAYARHFGGPTSQWMFLTGPLSTVDLLAVKTFHVISPQARLAHSTRFMLVDKNGHIRAYESVFDPQGIDKLKADAKSLAG